METPVRHPIIIISGGIGASGEQLVNTVLAQFPQQLVHVAIQPHIRFSEQLKQIVEQARQSNATIVHTMVDPNMRGELVHLAGVAGVVALDLMGPLIERLEQVLGVPAAAKPGLYRQFHREYFDRVEAIEYTQAHDDGKNPSGWSNAEIILTGVSRTGKTPLSVYLSVLGWKVANIPLVPGVEISSRLFELDRKKVIGLTIAPDKLLQHRRQRSARLGVSSHGAYADPDEIMEELSYAERIFRRGGFITLDVTDKTIEASADEIIRIIS